MIHAFEPPSARKVLRTLRTYWAGLVLFLEHPWLELDNNAAERAIRPAVVGRKKYYGSGSQWSGQLAATMMSLLATARLWHLNPRTWLSAYAASVRPGRRSCAPGHWPLRALANGCVAIGRHAKRERSCAARQLMRRS